MYYQNYEDYMRSVLGYPVQTQNTYETYNYSNEMPYQSEAQMYTGNINYSNEIMDLYPEIYKIVNPMVCKICEANTKPITRELIEKMTDEIYSNLESEPEPMITTTTDTVVNVRVNTSNGNNEKNSRSSNSSVNSLGNSSNSKKEEKSAISENRDSKEVRQFRTNRTLRDLIKILILNRLLRGGFFPERPPRPRSQYPISGEVMPQRPPIRPPYLRDDRYYDGYLKF